MWTRNGQGFDVYSFGSIDKAGLGFKVVEFLDLITRNEKFEEFSIRSGLGLRFQLQLILIELLGSTDHI